ncbi:antibiotic biosynthesis monooxygenase [Orbaceae bacterium ESL0721]|nr:antibiotic biosynthesis monooxygenase [Orbaceae bacterium ESL0721]
MYVTMNRFKIKPEYADEYLKIWENSALNLSEVPGFIDFKFFQLDKNLDGYVLFSSYATWDSKASFKAWTQSDHFKKAHSGNGDRNMYIEHPELECFEVLIDKGLS